MKKIILSILPLFLFYSSIYILSYLTDPSFTYLSKRFQVLLLAFMGLIYLSYIYVYEKEPNLKIPNVRDLTDSFIISSTFFIALLVLLYFNKTSYSLVVSALILSPIFEELFFRGTLLQEFIDDFGERVSIFLSSGIFAVYHLFPGFDEIDWVSILLVFIFSMGLSYFYIKKKNILLVIIAHFLYNSMLLLTSYLV